MNAPKLRLPQAALLFAVTSFLPAETIVREARWLIPKGETLISREFREIAVVNSEWELSGNLKIDQAQEAVTLRSEANDPFLKTALPAGTRGPLLVTLRCRANTYASAQLFWRGDKQGYASIRSTVPNRRLCRLHFPSGNQRHPNPSPVRPLSCRRLPFR